MRTLFFASLLSLILPTDAYSQNIDFEEALQKQSIKLLNASGNPESTHYINPLRMSIQNLLNTPCNVILKAGTYFASEPAEYQDITVMKDEIIAFKPNETKILAITGVCTEPQNIAPKETTAYSLAPIPKNEFAEFARFVNKEKLYKTSEAQTGMWFLCRQGDNISLIDELHGCGSSTTYTKIFNELARIKKLNLRIVTKEEKTAKSVDYITQYFDGDKLVKEYVNSDAIIGEKKYQVSINNKVHSQYSYTLTERHKTPSCEMSGGGFFTVSQKNIKISMGMFDKNDILVREIYANDNVGVGQYTIKYAYDCEKYKDDVYYFKTIKNDKVAYIVKLSRR
jgi:hypothetical protein